METLIGIVGVDFVLLAADANSARSIILMKEDVDKINVLDENKLLGAIGDTADRDMFCEFVEIRVTREEEWIFDSNFLPRIKIRVASLMSDLKFVASFSSSTT